MAESVNRADGKAFGKFGILLWALLVAPIAIAEVFLDPTRPPTSITSAQTPGNAQAFSGPTLQSVILGPGRKTAIISGETVKLGEKYGDAILDKITEAEVVLRTGNELKILKLYPGIDKRSSSGHASSDGMISGRAAPARTGSKPERHGQ